MKQILSISACLLLATAAFAQPKVVDKAIVKVKTEIIFPENFSGGGDRGGGGGGDRGGGGEMAGFTMPREMETNTTMYYTPNFMRVESLTDFGNNIVITDRVNKKTTTLIESMGRKTGFFSTDAEAEAQRARMDSMRNLRRDSLSALGISFKENKPELIYSEETKKVSGYTCKKVTIRSIGQNGQVSENVIWYNPDFKISPKSTAASANPGGFGGGRSGGMSMMSGSMPGLDLINGFPMEYEMVRGNGFKMHMTVLKIQPDAQIDDKTFEVPKGFDIKPMGSGGDMMRTIFRNGRSSEN
ncbi:MAG: hypothetical protein ACK5GP_06665 [bacterium]|jgi:hypothetical protein